MVTGFFLGIGAVLLIALFGNTLLRIIRRFRKKEIYLSGGKRQMKLTTYIEMSKHNNQAKVDRLFGLRKW